MRLLDAVNLILPVLGEHPVTSINVKHPTLAVILPKLELERTEVLNLGLWFNQYSITLYPDSEGGIAMPVGTLAFLPDSVNAVVRGPRLMRTDDHSYVWGSPVTGNITVDVPFEELPESVAGAVMYGALVDAYVTDIGMEQNVQMWQGEAREATLRMNTEHLRNMRYSTRQSKQYKHIRNAMRA